MRIHSPVSLHSINPYAEAEKTIAEKRAAEMRRKLLRAAHASEEPETPVEESLLGEWLHRDEAKDAPKNHQRDP